MKTFNLSTAFFSNVYYVCTDLGLASTAPGLGRTRARVRAAAARWRPAGAARPRLARARAPTPRAPTTRAADHDHGRAQGILVAVCYVIFVNGFNSYTILSYNLTAKSYLVIATNLTYLVSNFKILYFF